MKEKIAEKIEQHVKLLRENSTSSQLRSIYDFDVYNNIFIEDIEIVRSFFSNGTEVLDFGCGRGTTSYVLASLGYNVTGLDISYAELDKTLTSYVLPEKEQRKIWEVTKAEASAGSLRFNFYDGTKIPYEDETFDAVFAYAVLEHVDNLEVTLKELYRVLKPEGRLFIARTPNTFSYAENMASVLGLKAHEIKFTKKQISNLLNLASFKIEFLDLVDFFPSNIPGSLNKHYQRLGESITFAEKILRYTPLKIIAHHFRIGAKKN